MNIILFERNLTVSNDQLAGIYIAKNIFEIETPILMINAADIVFSKQVYPTSNYCFTRQHNNRFDYNAYPYLLFREINGVEIYAFTSDAVMQGIEMYCAALNRNLPSTKLFHEGRPHFIRMDINSAGDAEDYVTQQIICLRINNQMVKYDSTDSKGWKRGLLFTTISNGATKIRFENTIEGLPLYNVEFTK